ncbi:glycerol facilitator-aquaporin gla [Streptococcus criceti]|uniref:Glycerol facilitator-aquaporin n=2 Tax=Streptococcus criceti TaxID=1333 RepID=G5JRS7_STRCG|nr:aquaglyceroporin Gla [Streptococcus criceti]EHI73496.1 glycerol facilitator-aquaporin [Streptococcus criceti HS-6]SUN43685.1 glycerol facilitator-aquaporin gla [Streptococcus criceti]BAO01239.1 glycerol uptake permease [Streptococcus criceti]BAO01244.1 glycerol uptake permease [Streptococcus criceti]BAO01249.1 glycerol uptake permease [Streptococcus criceti]
MNEFFKEALTHEWLVKYATEVIATALMVLIGNGSVANVELKGTKGHKSGWLVIGFGYGFAVMLPALMFGTVSGNHINPAFTLGLAVSGLFKWTYVPGYLIAQMLGAMLGQGILVMGHAAYYQKTEDPNAILGSFSTISALDDGTEESRRPSTINGFINEFIGTFVLIFGALALTHNYFGSEALKDAAQQTGMTVDALTQQSPQIPLMTGGALGAAHLGLGFLVAALVISLGGPTGPALNPVRDLGPRLLHHLLPETVLGEHKGDSKWWYAWVPVVAPIIAGIIAAAAFKALYM